MAITVIAILWAGLAPFEHNPPNDAQWGPEGLRFRGRGLATLEEALTWEAGDESPAFTIALAIRSGGARFSEPSFILALDDGRDPPLLRLGQKGTQVRLARREALSGGGVRTRDLGRPGAFWPGGLHFVAVVSGPGGTRIHVDGESADSVTSLDPVAPPGTPFGGKLILGTTADGRTPWEGTLRALAIYDRALEEDELRALAPKMNGGSGPAEESALRVVVLPPAHAFSDTPGDANAAGRARSPTARRAPLLLPERYTPLRPRRLATQWLPTPHDAILNLLGFVPFGALVAALRRGRGSAANVGAIALMSSVTLSLAIELLQVGMPVRDSSLYDWLLNTAGGAVGAGAWILTFGPGPPHTSP